MTRRRRVRERVQLNRFRRLVKHVMGAWPRMRYSVLHGKRAGRM